MADNLKGASASLFTTAESETSNEHVQQVEGGAHSILFIIPGKESLRSPSRDLSLMVERFGP